MKKLILALLISGNCFADAQQNITNMVIEMGRNYAISQGGYTVVPSYPLIPFAVYPPVYNYATGYNYNLYRMRNCYSLPTICGQDSTVVNGVLITTSRNCVRQVCQ